MASRWAGAQRCILGKPSRTSSLGPGFAYVGPRCGSLFAESKALAPAAPADLRGPAGLARVVEIDIEQCPQCGGTLKIIAAIEHPPSSPKSSRISACPPGHRPDPRCGYSIDSE